MRHIYTNCSYNIYTPTKLKIYGSKVYTVEFLVSHPAGAAHWSRPKHVFLAGPVFRPGRAGFKATGPGRV